MQPVPIGVPGELYAAGDGLARGYSDDPGLTAERFVPDPRFADPLSGDPRSCEPEGRLYRTGDLARWLPDGKLEFLGRLDHQVKIRGYRIELGEIETLLAESPAVQEAVVVAREVHPGDKQLVAYVVGRGPGEASPGELREALRRKLPDYMVPGIFVALERLPLNPNGKVDRGALPEPDPLRSELALSFVAPRIPEEEILAAIWCELLGLEKVGVNDDFFELGGHSLLATQVISRLWESFAVELDLLALFEAPTIAGLGSRVATARARKLPPIEPRPRAEGVGPVGILLRELVVLYEAELVEPGGSSPLPDLAVQYADFTLWQRRWMVDEVLDELLSYWREKLQGAAVLELPTDRPRPAVQTFRGGREGLHLPAALSRALHGLSQERRATLFMTLLAAFAVLLRRLSGQDDLVVGSPIANRRHAELEPLVGFFVNTLTLRCNLAGDPEFSQLLEQVREEGLGAYAHQDLPFEKLVEELRPQRDLSRNPLFQVALAVQNLPKLATNLGDLTLRVLPGEVSTTRFDLEIHAWEAEEGLRLVCIYDQDLYDRTTVRRLARWYQAVLEAVVNDPSQRLSAVPMLSRADLHQLLVEWNDTRNRELEELAIAQLFAAQVAARPEAIAVLAADGALSYRELNARANRLAHRLRAVGVGGESLVALSMERSSLMVWATLGILKAGGAYLPLDPAHPEERLAGVLAEAEAAVLLVDQPPPERLTRGSWRVLVLDSAGAGLAGESTADPGVRATADQLAYVMYTSGSTGRPKGISIPQRAVRRLVLGSDYVQLTPSDRVAQVSNSSFDAVTFEIWGALLTGACLVVVAREAALSPPALAAALAEQRITALFLTTALFNQLARHAPATFAGLRHLLFGGEAADPHQVRTVVEAGVVERLLHVYGPTENTTFSTWHRVAAVPAGAPTVPIGLPIANTTAVVLDRRQHPVPVGAVGELYLGGDGLGRGYLGHPAQTAERFVPDLLAPEPEGRRAGTRLYRTGDLVRQRSSGEIEFVGRIDHQVKLRGFRIELGEIEAVLSESPAVQEAVVVAREVRAGDRQLVAYVVGRGPGAPATAPLREALQRKLPDYMVPATFVALERLPLNPNGKIDRGALPAPDLQRPEFAASFVAPQTPEEEILAAIWAEVLDLDKVGVNDDFFELGGHSLLATRVISRLRESFRVAIDLRVLFETPTIAALAARVAAARALPVPPIEPLPREGGGAPFAVPLSFAQERMWLLDHLAPGDPLYNISLAWRLAGPLLTGALDRGFRALVRRHEILRTRFPLRDEQPFQVVREAFSWRLPVVDLRGLAAASRQAEAARLTAEEARRRFDLATGPLLRVILVRREAEDTDLLLSMHHIISDGWSLGVLLRELMALYQVELAEPAGGSPLPALAIQYADFALWQRRWLEGEVLAEQLAYWRQKLAGAAMLELPTDRPRPEVQTFRGKHLPLRLPAALTSALGTLSREHRATLFMTLLAAVAVLFRRLSGQDDVVIGSPIANRHHAKLEGLLGFFANTLALRNDLAGDPAFGELLARVRETALDAYAHQDLPFEKLVEDLQPERDLSGNPLFRVMFAFQNAPLPPLELAGLKVHPLPVELGTVRFDLELQLWTDDEDLRGSLTYNRDLFDPSTMRRVVGNFRVLLTGMAAGAQQRLSELPLLSGGERQQLLAEWNDTRIEYPQGQCFHDRFASRARRSPDAVAAVFADRRLSYGELDRRANQLAHHLRQQGVGPEVLVGLCLSRSPELLVGILGILKAGGAYLPLDPNYPTERLAFMLEDSEVPILVSRRRLAAQVLAHPTSRLICLDEDRETIARQSEESPLCKVTPSNLAYAIYTSGSTGRPKAVLVPHLGVCSMSEAQLRAFGFGPGDRLLQFSSLNFDAATFEIVMALGAGSTLCLGTREELLPGPALIRWLRELQVTAMLLPPSALAGVPVEELPALHTVITAGEACPASLVERWGRERRFFNLYGPTEATIWTTAASCSPGGQHPSGGGGEKPPIGGPIANTQVFVLDRHLQPVPLGLPGELTIGGVGVARGYQKHPELTAERFIPNPFSELPGTRLYRTGDLARYLPDGRLEFGGRTDFQVKIRGFRIELGEIETQLSRHPAVRAAVAVVREDLPGDKRLVAYIVPDSQPAPPVEQLRSFLQDWLPDHMIPATFYPLEVLPLTPNGKVDRRALPAPEELESARETPIVAPRTEIDQTLVEIWKDVLQTDQVGIHDNFFDLGGHSMHMAVIAGKLQEAFGFEQPLIELFQHPTIRSMAELVAPEEPERVAPLSAPETVESPPQAPEREAREIAVIGMAGRFPGAAGLQEFWHNLRAGVESISVFTDEDLESAGLDDAARSDPRRIRAGGVLEGIDLLDASFFGMKPREAELTDPQQRLFLEEAWNALENAGYVPGDYPGLIGVYAGTSQSTYWTNNVHSNPEILSSASGHQALMTNDKDFLPTRVSYKLNLRGPSLSVQTACSTSLVAIHQACQSLLNDECDMALAGGVSVRVPQKAGYSYQEGGILSPDGHCRAFDAAAEGTIPGEGVGIVVLKKLADALADGDSIRAIIKGSAVNNDGSR